MQGSMSFGGQLTAKKIRARGPGLRWQLANYLNLRFIWAWLGVVIGVPLARAFGLMTAYGRLEAVLIRADGERIRYGVLSYRSITNAYVNFLALMHVTDATTIGDFKYHDSGVGVTAENVTDVDIETTDAEARATGNQTNPTSPTYASVGTIAYTTTKAITEHGLFNASTSVTLMDRSKFTAINVVSGDSIQFTYTLTLTAGG